MFQKHTVDISMGVVFRTALFLVAVWFLYLIREILALLFVAILIVVAIDPIVDFLQRKKIPRSIGVLAVYILLFSIVGLSISLLIPALTGQFTDFSQKAPFFLQKIESVFESVKSFFQLHNISLNTAQLAENMNSRLATIPDAIFSETVGLVRNIISIVVVLVMAFYMTVKENGIKKFIVSITPEKHKDYAISLTERMQQKIGKWIQGQLILMLTIFILDFVGLYIIGIPYALPLAIFAGITEIVPYVGPIISAIPSIILGLLISPLTGLATLLLYFFAQQFESHIIVPQVMKKAVGLNPIAVILALLVGVKLGGILGAILAIPLATVISVFVGDLMRNKS
ncbi:MAG: hypothetical protein COX30_01565 [Candidatus Moranbacteria bacterium CG23_combo_of_CG06-09_8_20_14_all_39_10]|nr:MAG: hypothetical protein COX30_01565 [Candidatus Moranbacteria bacterium CG23_combo_of_CG06-09_8_20_14_all_39_10]